MTESWVGTAGIEGDDEVDRHPPTGLRPVDKGGRDRHARNSWGER